MIRFLVCWLLTSGFDPLFDPISKLGTIGAPYRLLCNTVGFGLVGVMLALHGICFELARGARILGRAWLIGGVGFAAAAIPTDFADASSSLTRGHYASFGSHGVW